METEAEGTGPPPMHFSVLCSAMLLCRLPARRLAWAAAASRRGTPAARPACLAGSRRRLDRQAWSTAPAPALPTPTTAARPLGGRPLHTSPAPASSSDGDDGEPWRRRRGGPARATPGTSEPGATAGAALPWTPSPDPAAAHAWHRRDLALVLVHPVIPHNTGATARTCAAAGVPLHIVGPIGFSLQDKGLRRAGLDYWPAVAVAFHENFDAFLASLGGGDEAGRRQRARLVAFSKLGTHHHAEEGMYKPPPGGGGAGAPPTGRTFLLFGAETTGLPPEAHAAADAVVRIPIITREVRSLNLAVSAGVGLFEAVRQLDGAVLA